MRIGVLFFYFLGALSAQQGIIATVAGITDTGGNPMRGYSGDDGMASSARLSLANLQNECDPARYEEQSHLWADRSGNIFIADANNQRIRRIGIDGRITTVAGSGERPSIDRDRCSPLGGGEAAGDGGAARSAKLYGPSQAIQLANGNLLICDQKNNRIRQVNAQGNISTIVGSNLHTFYAANIPATLSPLDWPTSIAADASSRLYFSELHSHRVARVNADGRIQTIAGTGLPGAGADGPDATRSSLSNPTFILVDRDGNVLVAEQGNHRVRRIRTSGAIETVAGTGVPGYSGDGGRATAAQLTLPNGLALDSKGNLYVADMGNHRVRRIAPDGTISTVAGNGQIGRGGEGLPAVQSPLHFPSSVAVDHNDDLYVADWQNYLIRKVSFAPKPAISAGGVVNAASFLPAPVPLAPGALVSIFGINLAAELTSASAVPLPVDLAGVSVTVNGVKAPLVFVSQNQVNFQLPYELRPGQARIQVTTQQGISNEETVNIGPAAPGIFMLAGGNKGVVLNQDGSLNTEQNPEQRGRVLVVFLTGIGVLDGEITAGQAAPGDRLLRAVLESSATIGGRPAEVLFLGLTPGFVGLAQANLLIPPDAPAGSGVELTLSVNRQRSNPVQVGVR